MTVHYEIVEATPDMAAAVEAHLSRTSRSDWAAAGGNPQPIQDMLRKAGAAYAGLADGQPVCIFGANPTYLMSDTAILWLWTTDDFIIHSITFAKRSRPWIAHFKQTYSVLTGAVDAGNPIAIRWLQWVGCTVSFAQTVDGFHTGRTFHPFSLEK